MDITGTTAKEANSTISGSVASMKASWQNLLVGIADENADFKSLTSNFVDSVVTVGQNIIPRIESILGGLGDLITEASDKLIPIVVETLTNNLPTLIESGIKLVATLITGLVKAIPQLVSSIPQIVTAIVEAFKSAWPSIKQAGVELIQMVGQGISSMISSAWSWGSDMIRNFIDGIKSKAGELWGEVKGLASGVANFLGFSEPKEGPLSNFHTYAPDMMALFAQGIRENESLVTDQIARSFDFSDMISVNAGDASYGAAPGYGGDNVTINVYGAQGQSAEELAEKIEQIFVSRARKRGLLNA